MKYFSELKIDFRAVPYSCTSHVLEYRISPDQDITYYQEFSFFGLFKFKIKRKFDVSWVQPNLFHFSIGSEYYSDKNDWNYMPLFIDNKEHLEEYKRNYKTIGAWVKWMNEKEALERAKYERKHAEYLEQNRIWQ